MKLKLLLVALIFCVFSNFTNSQDINLDNIDIYRDGFGVPYIYSETDVEAAFALAWVQAEDHFHVMQEPLLATRGLLSSVTGKEGALLDALGFLLDIDALVEQNYDTAYSDDFKKILEAYAAGINKYAADHPKEVLHKKLFPMTAKDIAKSYAVNMGFMANVQYNLARIFENELGPIQSERFPSGSNGFALSPKRTAEGKTYVIANSHQPLAGFASWYEVQIHTNEGWGFHGATFAAGVTPFVGTNENLGWTHCVNYNDFNDVYKLKMHPKNKNQYYFDGEWLELEERKLKLKVKVAGVKIPVSRTFYKSKYGATIKNKSGFYAIRLPANLVIGAAEQWYRMNKSNNLEEFKNALAMQKIPSLNVIYGDKEGNILFVDNGLFPYRNPNYDWENILPGDTSATLWETKFMPMDSLIQVENPDCGYVFNSNNTGFDCTCPNENPNPANYDKTMGYQQKLTARSIRVHALIDDLEKISYQDLKRIKYDSKLEFPLYTRAIENLDVIRNLSVDEFPDIKEVIAIMKKWDGSTSADNKQAAVFSLAIQHLIKYLREHQISDLNNTIPEIEFSKALRFAQKHLLKKFGKLEIELGELQKHVRGDVELPIGGVPEAIAQMYTVPYKNGKYKSILGESFILFASFNENGLEKVETINCYGASSREDNPHYTDQMEMYTQQKLKPISMDRKEIEKNAEKRYKIK